MSASMRGEEIFECNVTDASASAAVTVPPGTKTTAANSDIDTYGISASEAFEVFNGKLFGVARIEHSVADAIERRFVCKVCVYNILYLYFILYLLSSFTQSRVTSTTIFSLEIRIGYFKG